MKKVSAVNFDVVADRIVGDVRHERERAYKLDVQQLKSSLNTLIGVPIIIKGTRKILLVQTNVFLLDITYG